MYKPREFDIKELKFVETGVARTFRFAKEEARAYTAYLNDNEINPLLETTLDVWSNLRDNLILIISLSTDVKQFDDKIVELL